MSSISRSFRVTDQVHSKDLHFTVAGNGRTDTIKLGAPTRSALDTSPRNLSFFGCGTLVNYPFPIKDRPFTYCTYHRLCVGMP